MSTHADPSNSSQMQLETPGGVGVSCPCERRAMVEFKPKTDTGLCVAKWPACNHYTSPIPQLIPQNVTHHILIWNDHPQPGEQKGDDTAEILLFFFEKNNNNKKKKYNLLKASIYNNQLQLTPKFWAETLRDNDFLKWIRFQEQVYPLSSGAEAREHAPLSCFAAHLKLIAVRSMRYHCVRFYPSECDKCWPWLAGWGVWVMVCSNWCKYRRFGRCLTDCLRWVGGSDMSQ